MADKQYIRKVVLDDGSTHYFYDEEAIHTDGGTVAGNLTVNGTVQTDELFIAPHQAEVYDNVLVEDNRRVLVRDRDALLGDIGGASFSYSDETLKLKVGR